MTDTTKGSWKFASVTHPQKYVGSSEIIEMNDNTERKRKRRGEEAGKENGYRQEKRVD